jgi:MFS family permease
VSKRSVDTTRHTFRDLLPIAVPAYGPTLLGSIGAGAVIPVIASSGRELGGSFGVTALLVALLGIGQVLTDLPAGALAARFGERKALLSASALEFVGGIACLFAPDVAVLALGILLIGSAQSMFGLARQSYLTAALPVDLRARGLSTLGGTYRIGIFIGPFVGAVVVGHFGAQAAYAIDMAASVGAFLLVLLTRDITANGDPVESAETVVTPPVDERPDGVLRSLVKNRRILRTLGVGILLLSSARACRQAIVPLWAASIGMDPAHISLLVGIAGAVDVLLFYPSGAVMDKAGRMIVAVPSMIGLGVGMVLVVFTSGFVELLLAAVVLAVGNGLGAGLVMTLGADAAPANGRPQFLGGWRLMSDTGSAGGPLIITAVTALLSLTVAGWVVGVLALVGAGWLGRWIPAYDPISRATLRRRSLARSTG